jgi:hypothetical protein
MGLAGVSANAQRGWHRNPNVAPSVTTQPASQTVTAGQTATFSVAASGTAPFRYQWQKNGAPVSGATSTSFTTPAAATSDSGSRFTVVVRNSGGSVTSKAATLTVNATPVAITVTPNNASVTVGSTQQFIGNVTGTSNTAVTWTASGTGCKGATCGTISNNGLYVSPASVPSPATVIVNATSMADPTKSASASLTIAAAVSVLLSLTPTSANVPTAGTQSFTASVTGTPNTVVSWSLSGTGCSGSSCGTLSTSTLSAVYSAPAVAPSPATVSVIATSMAATTKSASATVAIVPTVGVTLTPANVSVTAGSTQQFAASVTGSSNTAVTWTVSGAGCNGTACGTISSSGLYTAPTPVPSPATVTVTATSMADPTKLASGNVTITPTVGTSYYLATAADGGSDSNNGLSSAAPWLTPNHAVNCGDTITAAASASYSAANFTTGKWGTVTCSGGNNVAWLKCATFDACKISSSSTNGFLISSSYWGVQGWEVSVTGTYSSCFAATPPSTSTIHHIIFANDIANGCGANGVTTYNNGSASVDYIAIVGDIAYNAAQSNSECYSGISIYQPVQSDSLPGTHIYVAGNFSYKNVDPSPCGGATPTDGEGIIFDTWDGSQGALPSAYSAQGVAENNILISNGGRGFEVFNNERGTSQAPIYFKYNTVWGNNTDTHQNGTYCGEVLLSFALNVQAEFNVAATNTATGCGANPLYALYLGFAGASDAVDYNLGYSASGKNDGVNNSTGFSYGSDNVFGTSPNFVNPVSPGAPSCGSSSNVPNCMATIIADFQAQASQTSGWGYQPVSANQTYDPLFPQWLCNVNLPPGLVTMGCLP